MAGGSDGKDACLFQVDHSEDTLLALTHSLVISSTEALTRRTC